MTDDAEGPTDVDMTKRTMRLTLRIEGPITRSIFQADQPESRRESVSDILHWCWSTREQTRRFRTSLQGEFRPWDFTKGRLMQRRTFSATSYDVHLVFVAAGNLDRALQAAPEEVSRSSRLPLRTRLALRLLRNIHEHWDELREQYRGHPDLLERSARSLKEEFPGSDPWSFTFDPPSGQVVLAGIVDLAELEQDVRRLEATMLQLERAVARAERKPRSGRGASV